MKIIILPFLVMIAMIFMGCSDKENDVYIKNSTYSECATSKNMTQAQEGEAGSTIALSAVNENTLKVDMYHVLLNCGLERIESEISCNEGVIIIKITPIGISANCLCERQLTYDIGNLQEGQSYDCVIMLENREYASFKFDFTRDFTKEINPN